MAQNTKLLTYPPNCLWLKTPSYLLTHLTACDIKHQVTYLPTLTANGSKHQVTYLPILTDSQSQPHPDWLMIPLSLTHDPTLTDEWSHLQTDDPMLIDSQSHCHWFMIPLPLMDDPITHIQWLRIPPSMTNDSTLSDEDPTFSD